MFITEIISLVVSVAGNFSVGGFFYSSLFDSFSYSLPKDYGMIIFVLEFLNVHASAMAYGSHAGTLQVESPSETVKRFLKKYPKQTLSAFYLLCAITLGFALKSWVLPAYFAVGLITKFFGRFATQDNRGIAYLILMLLFSFVLGMRLWVGVAFFLFIFVMGLFYTGRLSLSQQQSQLFRDKLDAALYIMPAIIFLPLQALLTAKGISVDGQFIWPILYFPTLAINDAALFIRSRLRPVPPAADF